MAKHKINVDIANVMLSSVNGFIAQNPVESTKTRVKNGFANADDQEHLLNIVAQSSAVLIGWRTLSCEQGAFRVASKTSSGVEPLWIVFSSSGDVDTNHPFWKQKGIPKACFYCTSFNASDEPLFQAEHRELHGENVAYFLGNIAGLLLHLDKIFNKNNGKIMLALFGGAQLNGLFWNANLINHLYLTISPLMMNNLTTNSVMLANNVAVNVKLKLLNTQIKESFVFLDYEVDNFA